MALLELIARPPKLDDKAEPAVLSRLDRGRKDRRRNERHRKLYRKFWEGDHYWFMTPTGNLTFQVTGMVGVAGGNKPLHRVRNTYNYVRLIVESKTSSATQKVPGYEITPATDDPQDEEAAQLAEQVANYGYDKWRLRRHTIKAVNRALVDGEGFVMPYFDPNAGTFQKSTSRDPETGETAEQWDAEGEIKLLDLCRDEVMWEPGEFDESPWYAVERDLRMEEILEIPGVVMSALTTQNKDSTGSSDGKPDKLVITQYLERPCARYPHGRRMFLSDGRPVVDYRRDPACDPNWPDWWEPYPVMDADGNAQDEPPIHRISYTVNPDGPDMGLVERLVDPQRTINDCRNKLVEIKNRALHLQMLAHRSAKIARRSDGPGDITYYGGDPAAVPQWEKAPDPQLVAQLIQLANEAINELRTLAADVDIQADPRVSGDAANAAIQNAQLRWQSFLGDLAEFHSRVMRHCLMLVARYYTAERQVQIRGQYGWQALKNFTGQDLRSQVNVRVLPGSLETKSREAIQNELSWVQTNWPGAIAPEAALGVLHGGSAAGLIRSYAQHVGRARRVVDRLMNGGPNAIDTFGTWFNKDAPNLGAPPVVNPTGGPPDPVTGQPTPGLAAPMGVDTPGWMPAPWDNVDIWRTVIGDAMCSEAYEQSDQHVRHAFELVWSGLDQSEQQRAAKQAAQQQMQAQSLGMGNAAAPQLPPPIPSRAGFTPENASPAERAPQ